MSQRQIKIKVEMFVECKVRCLLCFATPLTLRVGQVRSDTNLYRYLCNAEVAFSKASEGRLESIVKYKGYVLARKLRV